MFLQVVSPLTKNQGFGSTFVSPSIARRATPEQLEHDSLIMGQREQSRTALFDQTESLIDHSQQQNNQKSMLGPPLVNAIKISVEKNAAPFHFPGHKRGVAAPSSLVDIIGIAPFLHDATELPELDRFGYPTGPLLDAQSMAAELFGATQTWFLVCGTTCGILAAIMSACSPGDTLILARNSHVSATSAMVLCGAIPKYIVPEHNLEWDIAGGVTPSQVKMAIQESEKEGKRAAAVFVTSPTYNGVCSNLSEISQICHSHGIPLIVDEAHGAHFKFHPNMPKTALSQGADLVIQSTHKVLCSFSQSSMLHLSGNRIDRDRVHKCLQSLQTTSPNWLLLASLDATRDEISKNPNTLFNEVMELVQEEKEVISHIPGISLLDLSSFSKNFSSIDPLRMTIGTQELGLSGFQAYDILSSSHGIEPELIGTKSFTLAFSIGTTKEHSKRLVNGLKYLSTNYFLKETKMKRKIIDDNGIEGVPFGEVYMSCTPREAFFARKKIVNFEESIGEVCGEFICPFPPGIPVLIPGEVITKRAVDYLIQVRDQGAFLKGAADPLLASVVVCDF
ncbi:uncharacterized protein LOC142172897 isoform X1 [Nicotiana tabacum]|uniref:Uncharacterized protein LOC142172897 isoform X1 n=3 Tax=Nicotiana TaxID=4085 RepID=A0AC58T6N6_TOBAC|nr:PREDICTED: uncharacterized protein LOC104213727 isoform X1 [Nicotiana sylvestris]